MSYSIGYGSVSAPHMHGNFGADKEAERGGSPVGTVTLLSKEAAAAALAEHLALAEKELADAIESGDAKRIAQAKTSLKNIKGPAFPPIMLILGGVAIVGVVAAYFLLKDKS